MPRLEQPDNRITAGTRVGVAMSGGVDSTVTAALLRHMGCRVTGFFLVLAQPDLAQQLSRVRQVAAHLEIPLEIIDLQADFAAEVLGYFTASYLAGRTPNPCVFCNPRIKFGRLLDRVLAHGCELLATGHYARIAAAGDGLFHLYQGVDPNKDQSYFLHQLQQEQLRKTLMPLGGQLKDETYRLAGELGLAGVHADAESQDVCFLKAGGISGYFAARAAEGSLAIPSPGPIYRLDGTLLGRHHGIHHFTIGQRRGLGIPDATPYYVVALDAAQNAVIVGKADDLLRHELLAHDVSWVSGREPALPRDVAVKIRYRHQQVPARVAAESNGLVRVSFAVPQQAVTPGQFAVFYDNDEVIGGGEIAS